MPSLRHPRCANPKKPGVILAVDDMPENRELISRLLIPRRTYRHFCRIGRGGAGTPRNTRCGCRASRPDDARHRGCRSAQANEGTRSLRATPVIMISGRQDMDQIIACIQAGADDYLLKPFNPVCFRRASRRALSESGGMIGKKTIGISLSEMSDLSTHFRSVSLRRHSGAVTGGPRRFGARG